MIQWKKKEAGEYESKDERFYILKSWDRIYGNHWELHDNNESNYDKGTYHEETFLNCKLKAETIMKGE